jgi:hypothetical protein
MRHRVLALVLAAATALLPSPGAGAPPRAPLPEYPVKAAFLYHVLEFVEWPSAPPAGRIVIGVLGRDPFGAALDTVIGARAADERVVVVRRFATLEELEPCTILFISRSEMARLPAILARLRGTPVLTVGEGDRFAQRGGMIGFFLEDNRVRLEVNRAAAESAGLRISARLLAVARPAATSRAGS